MNRLASPTHLGNPHPVVGSTVLALLSLGLPGTSSAEGAAPMYRVQADVVRALGPTDHNTSPRGADGLEWTATTFDDSRWQAGSLQELNSIPEHRSRLYRVKLDVPATPPEGTVVMLRVDADDGLRVWLDGFPMGEWGSGKDSKPAGPQSIDVTSRLTPGTHTLALRVDNGVAGSKLDAAIQVMASDSPSALTADEWFKKNFYSTDEAARRAAIERARAVAAANPHDVETAWLALTTYTAIDPPDLTGAHRLVHDLIDKRMAKPAARAVPILLDFGEYDDLGALIERSDWGEDRDKNKSFNRGQCLHNAGRRDDALLVLRSAVKASNGVPTYGWKTQVLLEAGMLDVLTPALRAEAEKVERSGAISNLLQMAKTLTRLGDYTRARRMLATVLQQRRVQALAPLSELAFATGDFAECERLCVEAISYITVTPTRGSIEKRLLQVRLAVALQAQGKVADLQTLRGELDLQAYPNQPDHTLTAIRSTFHPRLQIAMLGDDRAVIEEAALGLYGALKGRAASSPCLDVDPEILADLALGLSRASRPQELEHVCGLIRRSVSDIALPANQASLGRAASLSGDVNAARKHLGDAALLAPDDWWIRRDLDALGK